MFLSMKKTLIILAAWMWSRFGGIKQVAQIGERGERLLDFTIQDAIASWFTDLIHIIRKEIESDYHETISNKFDTQVKQYFVYQEIDADREKPRGVADALSCSLRILDSVCAVVNADDYYGRHSMQIMSDYLDHITADACCMVWFILWKTLSENGAVNRWVCEIDNSGYLTAIQERKWILYKDSVLQDDHGAHVDIHSIVSMNFRGFHPDYLRDLSDFVWNFKTQNTLIHNAELPLPPYIDYKIHHGLFCKVLSTPDQWIGITYKEDIEIAKGMLQI